MSDLNLTPAQQARLDAIRSRHDAGELPTQYYSDHRPTANPDPSERELEVIALTADGLDVREIGERLGISYWTVKSHLKHLYRKLEAVDAANAVAIALRSGLIE